LKNGFCWLAIEYGDSVAMSHYW